MSNPSFRKMTVKQMGFEPRFDNRLMRTVRDSEFRTNGGENQKARLEKFVLDRGYM